MERVRVALIAASESSFVRTDRQILEEAFLVRYVPWNGKRSIPHLVWAILRSDVTFSWFALDHAYGASRLARLLGRKSIVVVGGVDAAKVPEIGYGAHIEPRASSRSRYALAHSDRVLIVADSLREDIARNTGIRREEIVTVPLGFDTEFFAPDGRDRTTVLTVGIVSDVNIRRKGLDTFVEAARRLPELRFVIVGANPGTAADRLRAVAPPNVEFLPFLGALALLEQYRRARVYVQASLYEGSPSALGEAMACGCVPVGTRVAGIPTLVGDTGFYVPEGDSEATARAIRTAYGSDLGGKARRRIEERFSRALRRQTLVEIVESLAAQKPGNA
jgi:glycosyltransferase involved in cell wall biosynthesis